MRPPPVAVSPVEFSFSDNFDRVISISIVFDETTRVITAISTHRDEGCDATRILIGTSPEGIPDDTDKVVVAPVGDYQLTQAELDDLASHGVGTIEGFQQFQITAGP